MLAAMAIPGQSRDYAKMLTGMRLILARALTSVPRHHPYSHGVSMGEVPNG
jgi:hypothetical protein